MDIAIFYIWWCPRSLPEHTHTHTRSTFSPILSSPSLPSPIPSHFSCPLHTLIFSPHIISLPLLSFFLVYSPNPSALLSSIFFISPLLSFFLFSFPILSFLFLSYPFLSSLLFSPLLCSSNSRKQSSHDDWVHQVTDQYSTKKSLCRALPSSPLTLSPSGRSSFSIVSLTLLQFSFIAFLLSFYSTPLSTPGENKIILLLPSLTAVYSRLSSSLWLQGCT